MVLLWKILDPQGWGKCWHYFIPYAINLKEGTILDFMFLTMISPTTGWFETIALFDAENTYVSKGEEITEMIIHKLLVTITCVFDD